jgi:hypothetical protein
VTVVLPASLFESLTLNQRVQGSSPCAPTNKIKRNRLATTPHELVGVTCGVTVQRLGAMSLNPTPEKALAVKSDGYLSASRAAFCPNGFPQGDEMTSAVPPTADICLHRGKCSDGPKGDIWHRSKKLPIRSRHRQSRATCLKFAGPAISPSEIDDQLELSRLNYREASRLLAFENPASTHGARRKLNFSFPTGGLSYRA